MSARLIIVLALVAMAIASPAAVRQESVVDIGGKPSFLAPPPFLPTAVRGWRARRRARRKEKRERMRAQKKKSDKGSSGGDGGGSGGGGGGARGRSGPCARNDVMCWCKKALEYTNTVRRKKGVKVMLKLGTQKQMDNAMRYARVLAEEGRLKHQKLPAATREVGCKRWIGGENLAFHYDRGDLARRCVDLWIGSKGHYDNLVRDWFREMVVGVHIAKDGRVYCVQTFAIFFPQHSTFGSENGPRCYTVRSG